MYLYAVLRKQYYFMSDEWAWAICGIFDSKDKAIECIMEWGGYEVAHWEEYWLNRSYAD